MVTVRKLPQLLLLLAVMFITAAEGIRNYSSQLTAAVTSLNRLLDYMLVPQSVIGDMIFGIVVARGQLAVLRRNLVEREDRRMKAEDMSTISLLEMKCEKIYKQYMPIRKKGASEKYDVIMDNIVQEDLWEVDYPLTLGKLRSPSEQNHTSRGSYGNKHNLTRKQKMFLLLTGRPNESQSDYCIGLLASPERCGTSPTCWDIMANKDEEVHGYCLTHRLLYLQVARQLGCGNHVEFSGIEKSIRNFCSDILVEMYHIIDLGVPAGFRDLFIEQVSLCGIEGFAEFLNPLYLDWVLSLQAPTGCFAEVANEGWLDGSKKPISHSRRKREDGALEDGCEMHISGLAAAFLALNIRSIVELWNPTIPIPILYRK